MSSTFFVKGEYISVDCLVATMHQKYKRYGLAKDLTYLVRKGGRGHPFIPQCGYYLMSFLSAWGRGKSIFCVYKSLCVGGISTSQFPLTSRLRANSFMLINLTTECICSFTKIFFGGQYLHSKEHYCDIYSAWS
jgi:hypothetical protein